MSKNRSNIIQAEMDDLEEIAALLEQCQLPSQDIVSEDLRNYFKLLLGGEIVGTIGLEIYGSYGLLRSLAVAEGYRGKGFAKELVDRLESYGRQLDLKALYLLTTTADSYFSIHGYTTTDRDQAPQPIRKSSQFSSVCPSSAVLMTKELNTD